eukprot:scaffold88845_cov30-Phaeocystis_antarctica.AAC.1
MLVSYHPQCPTELTLAATPRRPPNAALPQSSWSVPSRPTPTRRHGSSAVVAMAAEVTWVATSTLGLTLS